MTAGLHHQERIGALTPGDLAIVPGTPWNNPRGPCERFSLRIDAASPTYSSDLWSEMRANNLAILGWLRAIGPATTLVCNCASETCHGHAILRAASWLRAQDAAHISAR